MYFDPSFPPAVAWNWLLRALCAVSARDERYQLWVDNAPVSSERKRQQPAGRREEAWTAGWSCFVLRACPKRP